LGGPKGARLLDVPCGDGRLAIELAKRGYRVAGVDISPEFLAAAREGSAGNQALEWRQADMRELPWRNEFDGAFCAGSSFGFLGDEGDQAFLDAVGRTLKPGARFALDGLKPADAILPQFRERQDMTLGDIRFEAENRYDPRTATMESRYVVTRGAATEVKAAVHRIYTLMQLQAMLSDAGFRDVESLGSFDGAAFRPG